MIVLKRTLEMKVRFTKTELDALTKKARKSGLSREGYCRRVLNGTEVKEAPPADVPVLIQEVRRVGNNLNQIMKRANALGLLDVPQLRKALEDNRAVEKLIADTYTVPSDWHGCDLHLAHSWARGQGNRLRPEPGKDH